MREKDQRLAAQCRNWAETALAAEQWIQDNRDLAGTEGMPLCKELRSSARALRKLAAAASRKMCLAVFGPSQAGKSYLISALARDAKGDLLASFAGKDVDFITEINPEGGKESTGLVTRFTTTPPKGVTAENPVRLRLFSEMDLVRVFANTYYNDCQHEDSPNRDELIEEFKSIESRAQASPVNPLTRDDMEALRDYCQNYKNNARINVLNSFYWEQAARIAPCLELKDRAALFGMLWNGVAAYNELFFSLADALERLGGAPEASCPLEALVPRDKSIIDVALLSPDSPGADEYIKLEANGRSASLKRCQVTALTAELTIYMPEKPAPFFEYTDLLDFPGYRSRLRTPNLEETLKKKGQLENFFLRGKVAYLFERYCEERELTGMVLCIGPGNQEVQDLPAAVDRWIKMAQGATPAERRNHDAMLFFLLTKMDLEFEDKKGVTDAGDRWETRLKASLTEFFGRAHPWPRDWDGGPFKNVFLIRNPNVVCDVFCHKDGREMEINPEKAALVANVRDSFFSSRLVETHFKDPGSAWNAAMKPNDGGITLLREKLEPICDPDRKYNQTRDRANAKVAELANRLSRFHRHDELAARVKEKERLGKQLLVTLMRLCKEQKLPDFLSRFEIADHDLYNIALSSCECAAQQSAEETPDTAVYSEDSILDDLFGDTDAAAAAPKVQAQPVKALDTADVFCRASLEHWIENVREQCRSDAVRRCYQLDQAFMEAFANELIETADVTGLKEELAEALRKKSAFQNITREMAAWRMTSVAASRINSFVSWLGHDSRLGQNTDATFNGRLFRLFQPEALKRGPHGEPVVPAAQQAFYLSYPMDWLKAFYDRVVGNAAGCGIDFNPEQNNRLGLILDALKPLD